MKRIILALTLAVTLALSTAAADVPFTQFIPAESVVLDDGPMTLVDLDGSINGKVLTCTEKADDVSAPGFTFKFTVPEDGEYTIWGRVFYPSVSNNSLHYSVDGGDALIWDFPDEDDGAVCYNSWQYFYLTFREDGVFEDTNMYGYWTIENNQWRHAPNVLSLKAGEHTIKFAGREAGWFIDEFVVTELPAAEYDPNFYDGNSAILDPCKFCGTYWQHYCEDVYAATGVTAEQYYNETLYPVVEEAELVAEGGDAVATAPQTADVSVLLMAAMALTGIIVSKKRR